jgi:hypothetical protein
LFNAVSDKVFICSKVSSWLPVSLFNAVSDTLPETPLNNDTGNHDDTLEQMNTLSETALNNDTGNHDDTLEQMNTLSETALNNDTGNHEGIIMVTSIIV